MKHLHTFENFLQGGESLNEAVKINAKANQGKKFTAKAELSYGKINQSFYLFVGDSSVTMYDMFGPGQREEIAKWGGVPREEAVAHLEKVNGDESQDALAVVSVNVMGNDVIYAWLNGTRISAVAAQEGEKVMWENLTDATLSLAQHIISKTYLETKDVVWTSDKGLTQWPDFTQNDKEGLVPFGDLQVLQDSLVVMLQPAYTQYMSKYATSVGATPAK